MPRSNEKDVDLAVEAAKKGFEEFKHTSVTQRSALLNKIADIVEANLETLAVAETLDNGKAVRETLNADLPLFIDHFRYFASVIRAESGTISDLDENTISQEIYEPYGVVAQIIPWNFPLLMAAWKLAPAIAAGNCVVLKPASSTPLSILLFLDLIKDVLPKGVINVVNEAGGKIGKHLVTHRDVKKVAFNSGEVCTCPSRALIEESIYEPFMKRVIKRVKAIKLGNPLDTENTMGAQNSFNQKEKIAKYLKIAKEDGAECLVGGDIYHSTINPDGFYIEPTIYKGHNKMRIFQEEIFGPVLSVTTFKDEKEAIEIANDTIYGLGAGVWSRDAHQIHRVSRAIQAGRIWVNCYHVYPAHASFGGYKKSGIGRETHMMMLNNYRHTKNILTSFNTKALGFF
ncbi:aldehyde dehydrogenase family protein [Aliarcobacter skirrowii]|uniref:aldehyde dehydrogenase family protein n=1 Tax=Aliarcobacter skirrowii TaxID=28200 RepID=UPI0029A1D355|nr:aldehyde dehydrogenase family protein [Aliarcobacter skirrowii]MDX4057926.1 aldehyde dehydrogenase family protein [Aliarcobacter skirrowii]